MTIETKRCSRRKSSLILSVIVCVAMVLLALAPDSEAASWQRYESRYFVANSSAGKRKTLEILRELELFRAAVLQVANLRAPESAAKTEVLIFGKRKDFEKLGLGRNIAGFARNRGGRFLIVVSASGVSRWAESLIRHEFSHVLLAYHNFRYPMWFNEGFAELMATMDVREKTLEFTLGQAPESAKWTAGDSFDWNALIAEGWDYRSHHGRTVSSAYLQSWLLVHYAMLGNDFGNTPKLSEYFRLLETGMPSLPAFEQAFGLDGQNLWARELKRYSKRLFYLVYEFRPQDLDLEFRQSESDLAAVEALIAELR